MTDLLDRLPPEERARVRIDEKRAAAGCAVQDAAKVILAAARGVAVREFVLDKPHGRADYVLFVDGKAVGVIEAKKAGSTLTGVEWQSAKYTDGLPAGIPAWTKPLPFAYESRGVETRFTNGFDPDGRVEPDKGRFPLSGLGEVPTRAQRGGAVRRRRRPWRLGPSSDPP